jgi:hypothetical protein
LILLTVFSVLQNVQVSLVNSAHSFVHVLVASTVNTGAHSFVLSNQVIGGEDPFAGSTYTIVVDSAGNEAAVTVTGSASFVIERDTSSDDALTVSVFEVDTTCCCNGWSH